MRVPALATLPGKPNIEQHEEKPSEMATSDTRRTRFFMIGCCCLCVRETLKNHMQQHEAKLNTNAVPTRSVKSFENISVMLGMTAGLAIKKTVSWWEMT